MAILHELAELIPESKPIKKTTGKKLAKGGVVPANKQGGVFPDADDMSEGVDV